ncbi:hypothetical protein [Nocardia carnea]|uniref:hypothetical protein n=1 Tax=Nocardia carnea TaxID=37328 RepID=UPI003D76F00D
MAIADVAGEKAQDLADELGNKAVHVRTDVLDEDAVNAARYAAAELTLTGARDLSSVGVRLDSIVPGTMLTPIMELIGEEGLSIFASPVPFPKRLGTPDEYADLA